MLISSGGLINTTRFSLANNIEDMFQAGEKAGVVLLNLIATYDTVWLCRLHLKLLQALPDCHLVDFILEMLTNHSFTLHTSDGQHQASVLAAMLFNIYVHDLLPMLSKSMNTQTISPSYSLTSAGRRSKRASLRTCQPCPPTSRTGA